jgi:predicted ATPase
MLFGRDAEMTEVESRTRTSRLVTIVGPGGVGKTALSRATAARLEASYPLGARLVDLTRVDQPGAVAGAMAAQLGFDSFDALLASPTDRPALLLVDNCEHLLDATADALMQVLGACQQPTVIATSRSPLELPGESIVSLAPLALPSPGADPAACPSVQMFLQRARDAGADPAGEDPEVVAELCRRLDGLPLAIEIAAARTRMMSAAEITARLATTIDVLDRPRFRGDPRHRSIAATIRWSVELLTPAQARLLERLSVFAGPFTADSGQALAGSDGSGAFSADLDELINASLVTVEIGDAGTRYRLLDTVRRFGLDQLRTRGELTQSYDRFVDHVIDRVDNIVAASHTAWREAALRDLAATFDDIAEAITYTVAHDQTSDRAHRLSGTLWALAHPTRAHAIVDLCRGVLAQWPTGGTPSATGTIASLATAEYLTGQPDQAAQRAEVVLSERAGPGLATVLLHRVLGQSQSALGDPVSALETLRAGAQIGHRLGVTPLALMLDVDAAGVAAALGEVEQAVAALDTVIERSRATESRITECWARTTLGWVQVRSRSAAARATIDRALEQARTVDDPIAVTVGLRSLAYAVLVSGDLPAAVAATRELLSELLHRGNLTSARLLFDVLAAVVYRIGHPSWEVVAATARTLPITTIAAGQELHPPPTTPARPFPRHGAIAAARHLLAELAATQEVCAGPRAHPTPQTARRTITNTGDVWEFRFDENPVAVRSAKGVVDIVRLIEANGAEIHCLDLAGAGVEQSSVGDTIDATARRQYEKRIRDLQDDITDAEANSDFEKAYRHQVELDALIEHLAAALGQGNRTRRTTDTAERARSAVAHRVRTTIGRINKLHPALGRHLAHSINTGTYCSYRPERPIAWEVSRSTGVTV